MSGCVSIWDALNGIYNIICLLYPPSVKYVIIAPQKNDPGSPNWSIRHSLPFLKTVMGLVNAI